jgi:hypothetical protein
MQQDPIALQGSPQIKDSTVIILIAIPNLKYFCDCPIEISTSPRVEETGCINATRLSILKILIAPDQFGPRRSKITSSAQTNMKTIRGIDKNASSPISSSNTDDISSAHPANGLNVGIATDQAPPNLTMGRI